ncbi:O-antigen/teichoic acid export membrane protein [Bacillus mesophilus]|uniref:Lipopolysaccharide biosynthesis protein n=1 Tax=Bacillus mesophilus TaxID=1808955 RepID=A0A6M0QAX4_9BACI|nr:lipopolysaccharide biosynthesis protein [Bacillus mesophilus]MBM7662862.1 O-antigen/teichoic acid export membrane protein [Bacillus mesophilus]NEY73452.1 lipopolysaccharide biosynthesis protein [Bacillus mesophilus]
MKQMTVMLQKLKGHGFLNKVILLAGGTAVAQGLQVILSPVLTRLYTPNDFGVLMIFISIVGICSKVVDLRYPLAIPLPDEEDQALNLLALSLILSITITAIMFSSFLVIGDEVLSLLDIEELQQYYWLIGLSILGIGLYQSLNHWAIRKRDYLLVTVTKLNQSIVQLVVQLLFGFLKLGNFGLLLGDSLGRMGGSGLLATLVWKKHRRNFHHITVSKMIEVAKLYRRFPLYSSWSSLLNGAALQITPLLIAMNYGTGVAGLWALSDRVVGAPMGLVGTAVAQVFLGEGAKYAREDPLKFQNLFNRTAKQLFMWGVIPTILLLFLSPWLFQFIFGAEWKDAGVYVQFLALMYLAQFTMSPLSSTLDILQRQNWELVWDFSRVILVVLGISLSSYLHLSPSYAVLIYSTVMLCSYIALYILCKIAIKLHLKSLQ